MKFWTAVLIPVAMVAGCGGGTPAVPPPADPVAESAPAEAPSDTMDMTNIEMHLWPTGDAPGQDVKPLLSIRAQRVTGSMEGGGAEMSFEGAQAIVPPRTPEDAPIRFEAARGTFQENKRALLKDGVKAQVGDMSIALEDITWEMVPEEGTDHKAGMAFSDKPLKITSPTQNLEAARLRLYPDTNTMELYDVTGVITFSGAKP